MLIHTKFLIKKLKQKNKKNFNNYFLINSFFKKPKGNKIGYIKNLNLYKNNLNKYFLKNICLKPTSFFYFKKLLFFVKFLYIQKFKNSKKIKKNQITTIKTLLFLIKKNKTKTKFFSLMQKRFIFFLFKIKNNIEVVNKSHFIKKFLLSIINKKFNFKKNIIKNDKFSFFRIKYKKQEDNQLLYNKLVGMLIKKGNKQKAKNLLNNALLATSKEYKITPNLILRKIINKLKTSVEAKRIKIRRSVHFVAFPLKKKRKIFMISKWIILAAKNQLAKKTFDIKLNSEFIELINNKTSFSYKFKRRNVSKALQNKSNSHFRW